MDNLNIDYTEIDGAIFLSGEVPDKCLKRWWESHLEMLGRTIDFFQFCNNLIAGTGLESNIEIPVIYERGPDWVLMDLDPTWISLSDLEEKESEANKIILNELCLLAGKSDSQNSVYLVKMIENNSSFLRHSLATKRLIIAGLEVY